MNVKLKHSTSPSTAYLKDKGSILLRHINNNLTEYTMSTWQNTRSQPDRIHDVNLTEFTMST